MLVGSGSIASLLSRRKTSSRHRPETAPDLTKGFDGDTPTRSLPPVTKLVRIGVLGCGNVGSAFVKLVMAQQATIEARTGVRLEVGAVAVRNLSRERDVELAAGVLTRDAHAVVADPSIDLVVEVIGGIEPARELITSALRAGKPVVTANKELLANVGTELFGVSDDAGVDLLFEAAVAGGIPIIRVLRESLRGEPITRVMGIINGTTNFILTKMTEEGADYGAALAEAQALGFAERDPTADVEGFDAGAKAAIMATIAFGSKVVAGDVYHEGISGITAADIAMAKRLGYVVKLLGIAEIDAATGDIAVRVHPAMVPIAHPLASVNGSYNAVFVEGARGRFADVLRTRRRRIANRQRGARRCDRCRRQPCRKERTARSARSAGRTCGRSTRRRPSTC